MRFSLCIHCPFSCSSKPSRPIQTPTLLKFKETPRVPSSSSPVSLHADEKAEVEKSGVGDGKAMVSPKSILKVGSAGSKAIVKGRVKWVDCSGKELAEIREFEHIEPGESMEHADRRPSYACLLL